MSIKEYPEIAKQGKEIKELNTSKVLVYEDHEVTLIKYGVRKSTIRHPLKGVITVPTDDLKVTVVVLP